MDLISFQVMLWSAIAGGAIVSFAVRAIDGDYFGGITCAIFTAMIIALWMSLAVGLALAARYAFGVPA